MEIGVADKLHTMEETLWRLTETLSLNKESSNSNAVGQQGQAWQTRDSGMERIEGNRPSLSPRLGRLDFLIYDGTDPTAWISRVEQYFDLQDTPEANNVPLTAFHLAGEVNLWWLWMKKTHRKKTHREEAGELDWIGFRNEL